MLSYEGLMSVDSARESISKLRIRSQKYPIKDIPIRVVEGGSFCFDIEGRLLPLVQVASTQLGNLAGLRRIAFQEYADNMTLVEGMTKHSLGKRTGEVFVEYNDSAVLGIKSDNSVRIDPLEVFDIAVGALSSCKVGDPRVESVRFERGVLQTRFVVAYNAQPARRVGDLTHGGILVASNGHVAAAPYLYRLVCTNGMVRPWVYPEMAKDSQTVRSYLNTTVVNLVEQAKVDLDMFMSTDLESVENPVHLVQRVTRELGISDRHTRRIGDALPAMEKVGDMYSRYDVLNLVSSLANSTGNMRFQEYAGGFMNAFQQHRCPSCAGVLV